MSGSYFRSSSQKQQSENEIENMTLNQVFDSGFDLINSINSMQESTSSSEVQAAVRRAVKMFEEATKIVSMISMYSDNEEFDDIATENVKYLLLPAFLGTLTLKLSGPDDRMHIIKVAEIYFTDFLKRVKSYGLTAINIPDINVEGDKNELSAERTHSNAEMVTEMVNRRNVKLQRYIERKELESKLNSLRVMVSNTNVDDEVKRDYFVTLIKYYINEILDELGSLCSEKQILEHMKAVKQNENSTSHTAHKPKEPIKKLQPIIITRDEAQKKVFGLGYPSLPIMTVKEFYEQRVKDGDWPDACSKNKCLQNMSGAEEAAMEEAEDMEKEQRTETDDPELLARSRAMDEYKDTHRRGWGNRANRS